jgi:hypothetical protein
VSDLQAGDVVVLKCDEIAMVIEHVEGASARCCWLDKDQRPMRHEFPLVALKKIEAA